MNISCELQRLYDSGLQFTLQPNCGRGFIVRHGDYLRQPENSAILPTFEEAVAWLRDRAECRQADGEYAARELTN